MQHVLMTVTCGWPPRYTPESTAASSSMLVGLIIEQIRCRFYARCVCWRVQFVRFHHALCSRPVRRSRVSL